LRCSPLTPEKDGDTFVVVDCGGGTVDLISYEVVSIGPMTVKECVKGQGKYRHGVQHLMLVSTLSNLSLSPGGLCGAVFVDEGFLELLERKFTKTKWNKMNKDTRTRLLHDEWEHGIKPQFDQRERTWKIAMPCVRGPAVLA